MTDKKTVFLEIVGAPHETDSITSLFRIIHESLSQGHNVEVWACGYATMLTRKALTDTKPGTYIYPEEDITYPTTSHLIKELIQSSDGDLRWGVCEYCKNDRGANDQIDEVEVMMSMSMLTRMNLADVSMVIGTF